MNPRNKRRTMRLGLESLENRIVLSAEPVAGLDIGLHGPGCSCPACGGCLDSPSLELAEGHYLGDGHNHGSGDMQQDYVMFPEGWLGDLYDGSNNLSDHGGDPLTVILDFNETFQGNTMDGFGNTVSAFDVTSYGFDSFDFELVTNSALAMVQEHYHDITWMGFPPAEQLAVEFEIGDIGTPPQNGSSDYYYIQIGSEVGTSGIFGIAGVTAIRDEFGNPGAAVGSVIGSVYTDNIQGMGNLTPADALSIGDLSYTTHALAGTLSHEIGHGFSLQHLDKAGSVTPTGLPPIMGTGAIDLPAQDRLFARDFAIEGFNAQLGGVFQKHLDQLEGAVDTHDPDLPYNLSVADQDYAYMFPAAGGDIVADTLAFDAVINFLGDVDSVYFAPQFSGTHTITIEGTGQIDPMIGIYDADTGAKLAFDIAPGIPFDAELSVELNQWQRYIIAGADFKSDATGDISITIEGPDTTATPTLAIDSDGLGSASVTLNPQGDVDAYRLVAPPNAVSGLTVSVDPDLGLDPVLVLWDTSGNEITRSDAVGNGVDETLSIGGVNPNDEYILTVFSRNYATSGVLSLDVEFSISALPPSLTSASQGYAYMFPAATGDIVDDTTSQNMFIGFGADVDSVYFAPQATGEHTIKIANRFNSVDPIVAVYDADTGERLAFDNDGGPDDDAELTISLTQWQRYIIAAADVGANNAGNIELTVEAPNTTSTTTIPVASNGQGSANVTITPDGDVDAFRFTAPAQGYGDLDVTFNANATLDAAIVLWDTAGNELDRSDVFGTGSDETVTISGITPGTEYILTVFSRDYATTGSGTIDIDFEIASPLQLVVDKLIDENDGNTSPGELSLREAIGLANANAGPDAITFDGTLSGTIPLTLGEIDITDSVTIEGPGASVLTIDAGGNSRIFDISDGSSSSNQDVEIRGITFRGGKVGGSQDGGAIRSSELLTIRESVFTGNSTASGGDGGALSLANYGGTALIEDSTFSNNSGGKGGAIRSLLGGITIRDSSFDGNDADGFGGAVYSFNSATSITDTTFSSNASDSDGGALWAVYGSLNVSDATFDSNQAGASNDGGAIQVKQSASASVTDSTFRGNSAGDDGGAIFSLSSNLSVTNSTLDDNDAAEGGAIVSSGGSATMRSSTLSRNTASLGGAVWNAGALTIVQSTISGNAANGSGGAIYSNSGQLTLQHTTVTNNVADADNNGSGRGGGIHLVFDTPLLDHTIMAGNLDNSGTAPDLDNGFLGGSFDARFSLIGDNTGATINNLGGNLIGTGATPVDPRLGPLAHQGGDTETHTLGINSPAIDGGDPAFNPNFVNPPLDLDQRGFTRVRDTDGNGSTIIDLGATELPAVPSLPLVVDRAIDESDGDYSVGDLSLREAIEITNLMPGSDTISFSPSLAGQTLAVTAGEIAVTDSLNIVGLGADQLTLDAQGLSRIWFIDDGNAGVDSVVGIGGMTLTGGFHSDGGAIYSTETLTLTDVTVRDNHAAASGGGLYSVGTLSVADSSFVDNSADFGGALRTFNETSIVSSTFTGNSANNGGAIRQNGATATVWNSTFHGNSTTNHGGAIDVADATFNLINSTISNNSANWGGGAVWAHSGQHNFIARHSTITNNVSDANSSGFGSGGALLIDNGRTATLDHTIVAGNTDNTGVAPDIAGTVDARHALIGNNQGTTVVDSGGNVIGSPGSPVDPMLEPLFDNGGATLTHALMAGSPGINAGDPMLVAGTGTTPLSDQRGSGFDRILGGVVDIGSFETVAIVPDGDFDGDGDFDVDDVDDLIGAIIAGTNDPAFDLTQDGVVDLADRDLWLVIAGEANLGPGRAYSLGDANLDAFVDGVDFIAWNSNKFTSGALWSGGDFNGDGFTDGQDFIIWNGNKFQSSDAPALNVFHQPHDFASAANVKFKDQTSVAPVRDSQPMAPTAIRRIDMVFAGLHQRYDQSDEQREADIFDALSDDFPIKSYVL